MAENQLGQIVNVTVALDSAPLTPAAFGRACILGPNAAAVGTVYTSLAGMVSDGIATTDQEYIEATSLLAQSSETGRRVTDWLVGLRTAAVAQVVTGTVTYDAASSYTVVLSAKGLASVTVGPVAANTDADTTAGDIATAIDASGFGARVNCAAVGSSSGQYTVTSTQAGIPFTMTVSVTGGAATHTSATTTANNGIAEDLAAIVAAGHSWYATIPVSRDRREIVEAAAWHESATPSKVLFAQFSDVGDLTGAYSAASPYADLTSELKALGYNRTATIYHATDADGAFSGWAGSCLPFDPGSQTWAAKKIVGVTADALTSSQISILTGTPEAPTGGKNTNVYIPLNDTVSRTLRGMMASGRRIDQQRTIDMLQNGLETAIANLLLSRRKLPFTNAGIAEIKGTIGGYLASKQTGNTPALNPDTPVSITVPDASAVSTADKSARILRNITATAQLAGAIEYVTFALTVSV